MVICPAAVTDTSEIDALLDAAFGPDRYTRTAALLRVGATPLYGPSSIARGTDGALLGTIQFWPITLRTVCPDTAQIDPTSNQEADKQLPTDQPIILLGPVAVARTARSLGLGRRLLAASLAVADAASLDPILLIGDASYYGPFGFSASATAGWSLPGPVERERLLLRQRGSTLLPHNGAIVPAAQAHERKCRTQHEVAAKPPNPVRAV